MWRKNRVCMVLLLSPCLSLVFLNIFFVFDNKYTTPPPYGQGGVLNLTEQDMCRDRPLYLIDGWLLSDDSITRRVTYIGEFANLQRGNMKRSPHGKATYELTLRYTGIPMLVTFDFFELFSDYTVYINDRVLQEGQGSARGSFMLMPGDIQLKVQTTSNMGYYSGIYYPPALGNEGVVIHVERIRTIFYAIACLSAVILASFTFQLWKRREGDRLSYWLGLLNIFFSLYVGHYFIHLLELPFCALWYFVEDVALYGLIFSLVQVTMAATAFGNKHYTDVATGISAVLPVALLVLLLIIPIAPWAVVLHGYIKDLYFTLTFLWLVVVSVKSARSKQNDHVYILAGSLVFSTGLLVNLLKSNLFEPIYTLWQFEWSGLLLVWMFGAMMIARNRRILTKNIQLTNHLERLVEQRVKELYTTHHTEAKGKVDGLTGRESSAFTPKLPISHREAQNDATNK